MNRPTDLQPTTPDAGQTAINDQAHQFLAAVEEAMQPPTSYRDDTPLPAVGTTPPVPQPGRPPMSQRATDASVLMLSGGAATVMVGGAASLVMLASGYADPTVCAIILGAPAATVLAVSRLMKRAKDVVEAAPPVHHHHYTGTVNQDHRSVNTRNRGLIANTRNELPR